jgi:cephalosporin hydroxylase
MFPLWDVAIAPVLRAAGARRVVEIGALRGETTEKMLHDLGADAELHVIDPVPAFDPAEHERKFAGRYVFHEALSLDVLPTLEPMDAALIDGDHNWYTVYHELRLLAETARAARAPLPVLVLHDVLWPYGRRDLYYSPETIPAEFRQPYTQKGISPGRERLVDRGGLNPTMNNALLEGGERNGVMTAVDDFVAEYEKELRVLVLPVYFGLAFVVETERLARQPELAAALDRLESAAGRFDLLEVSEQIRLRAMLFQHMVYFQRDEQLERARARHLQVLKASLLNEHYLDHEVRFAHLTNHITQKTPINTAMLRDPARHDQESFRKLVRARTSPGGPDRANATSFLPYTAMGRTQLDHLQEQLRAVTEEEVAGDLVECGTGRGGGAIFMRGYLDAYEVPDRKVFVADRFRASEPPGQAPKLTPAGIAGFWPDLNLVRDGFARFDLLDDRVRFLEGPCSATLPASGPEQVALLRIGRTAGDEVRPVLDALYDRITPGGVVVVDAGPEAEREVEAFRAERGIAAPLERVDATAIAWRRVGDESPARTAPAPAAPHAHPPAAPPTPKGAVDLTVVVVFYNMRREAARTLHSLSRRYQEDLGDVDYEVIVVENGSSPDERLSDEYVRSFGPEFRYIDLGDDAPPSPVTALNRGIREGRGKAFALMIDGAHVLTPGVLRFGLAGLRTYDRAIVVTQQWYVGPGQQGDAIDNGYDEAYEDRLFEKIQWPANGYRLFEIGSFVGDRDWFDGLWETNCMFVERSLLEQVGGFDESFTVAGGGYANLELYERLGSSPDVSVTTIIGEGSFHQSHGGTTTNQTDADERRNRVFGFGHDYAQLRGRAFRGPGKPIHFVGRFSTGAAQRSKPRRLSAPAFGEAAAVHDGKPTSPTPVPDELKWSFTEAVWRNLAQDRTTWLGHRIETAPTDLVAYQEMIVRTQPDWIVELGTGDGGRTLFLASICDLVGHGRVLSIDGDSGSDRPEHARVQYLTADAQDTATVDEVRGIVDGGRALVVLGECADRVRTYRCFQAYEPLVPAGSYLVVTDTIVNGHPVWPAFGPGPAEAVKQILNMHGDFVADPDLEKYSLTFNPSGFLKRMKQS